MASVDRTRRASLGRSSRLRPARSIVLAFALASAIGTALLMMPFSKAGPGGATFLEAFFTATSAVCVTGHVVVNTATYWTPFGQVVILALIQVGGFGIMTFASLIGLSVLRKISLRSRLTTAAETHSFGLDDVSGLLGRVLRITVLIEVGVAVLLWLRFVFGYGEPVGRAAWLAVFHSVSAFNNAGFSLFSDNLVGFALDPFICLPIAVAIILGGSWIPGDHAIAQTPLAHTQMDNEHSHRARWHHHPAGRRNRLHHRN